MQIQCDCNGEIDIVANRAAPNTKAKAPAKRDRKNKARYYKRPKERVLTFSYKSFKKKGD